jgi:hypothetical protein
MLPQLNFVVLSDPSAQLIWGLTMNRCIYSLLILFCQSDAIALSKNYLLYWIFLILEYQPSLPPCIILVFAVV